jgi:Outer membrane protein beta-barrel domain
MIRSVLLFSLLFATTAYGQVVQPLAKRIHLGVEFGYGRAYRTLSTTDNSEMAPYIVDSRNSRETTRAAFSGCLFLGYTLSDRWAVEAGVGCVRLGYQSKIDTDDLTFGDMIDPRRGFIYNTGDVLPASFRFIDDFYYAEVPVRLRLNLGKGRFRSTTTVGMAPAYLIAANSRAVSTYTDGSKEASNYDDTDQYLRFNLFATISTGVSYRLKERLEFRLEPMFRYGLLRITDSPVTGHLWSAGIGASCKVSL